MRGEVGLDEMVNKGKVLMKDKETEANWSKINEVLEGVAEKAVSKEELRKILEIFDLAVLAVQSNRSKLSGTGCKVFMKLFESLKNEMREYLPVLLQSAFGALAKSNKVISGRALNLVQTIGDNCSVRNSVKYLKQCVNSQNKSVRQGVLEISIRAMKEERCEELAELVELLLNDTAAEIRERAREGMQVVQEKDAKKFQEIMKRAPERIRQLIPVKKEAVARPEDKAEGRMVPSVIAPVNCSPQRTVLKQKESGLNVLVRGPIRPQMTDTIKSIEMRKALRPGYSLEQIGQRLEEHQKGVEEVLRKERTPKKTPISSKRQKEQPLTPSHATKRESEQTEEASGDNVENISVEIMSLSIAQIEETDQIVEEKEVNDTIFTGEELKGSKMFLQSCEVAADRTDTEITDYSILAPEVLVKRTTTKKIEE